MKKICVFIVLAILPSLTSANAQEQKTQNVESGSSSVLIDGKQAKRVGDQPGAEVGSSNVFIMVNLP